MENKKEQANNYFKEGKYDEAIVIYTEILDNDNDNCAVLSNRSASFIKINKYTEALTDAAKCVKLKPDWGKGWGRLGASLYGQCKYEDALVAFNKANELDPNEIYKKMIIENKIELAKIKSKLLNENLPNEIKNSQMGDMYSQMFNTIVDNPKIIEKIVNPDFQSKVLSLRTNPIDVLNDQEVMGVMIEMMKGIKL